jgi:hypothetical protein
VLVQYKPLSVEPKVPYVASSVASYAFVESQVEGSPSMTKGWLLLSSPTDTQNVEEGQFTEFNNPPEPKLAPRVISLAFVESQVEGSPSMTKGWLLLSSPTATQNVGEGQFTEFNNPPEPKLAPRVSSVASLEVHDVGSPNSARGSSFLSLPTATQKFIVAHVIALSEPPEPKLAPRVSSVASLEVHDVGSPSSTKG